MQRHLILCPFSKIIIVDSILRPVLRTPWFLAKFTAWVSSCGSCLISNQKVIGYPTNIHVTIKLMGISCHTDHYCSPQGAQVDKEDCWWLCSPQQSQFLLALWKLASKEEASWLVPCSVTSVHGVFSNTVLPSSLMGSQEQWQLAVLV